MIRPKSQAGLTLVEVLVAMVLMTILLVPAVRALHSGVVGADVHQDLAIHQTRLTSRLEELLALPYADLEAAAVAAGGSAVASSYSDSVGSAARLVVYLSAFDGDNADADDDLFTGTDEGLLWIRVEIENTVLSLQTVTTKGG